MPAVRAPFFFSAKVGEWSVRNQGRIHVLVFGESLCVFTSRGPKDEIMYWYTKKRISMVILFNVKWPFFKHLIVF